MELSDLIASIIGSGINGNALENKVLHDNGIIASIIGSGINGNILQGNDSNPLVPGVSLLLLEVELMETTLESDRSTAVFSIASIIGSGINGNFSQQYFCIAVCYRFYYWKWN